MGYHSQNVQNMPFPLKIPMIASKLHIYIRSDNLMKHRRDLVRIYLKNWLTDNDFSMSLNATYVFVTKKSAATIAEKEEYHDMVLG